MLRALTAGILLAAAAGPTGRWLLVPLALAFLYWSLDNATAKQRFVRGLLAAAIMFVVSLAWTRQFSGAGWPVLALVEATFFAVATLITPDRKHGVWRSALCFVAAITGAELIRIVFPLGGLPLGGFTTPLADSPLASLAEVIGEPGLVAVVASIAVGIVELLRRRNRNRKVALIPVVFIGVLALLASSFETQRFETLRVTTVQAGGPQALKIDQQDPQRVFEDHYRLTQSIIPTTGLIAWPEDVIDVEGPVAETRQGAMMSDLAKSSGTYIGAGVVETELGSRFRNAYVVWAPNGLIVSRYEKTQRVPFGEYVPVRNVVDRLADLTQIPSDAIAGVGPSRIVFGDNSAAVGISYEGLFARIIRSGVRDGGQFVVIPTNAASYKSPRVAKTQVESARFRAIESGRDVVQSAPTGISAFIDSSGTVIARSGVGGAETLSYEIALHKGETLYTQLGNLPLTLTTILVLLLTWAVRFARRAQDQDRSDGAQTKPG